MKTFFLEIGSLDEEAGNEVLGGRVDWCARRDGSTTTSHGRVASICRFDGRDFGYLKMQVEDLLTQKDLEDALLEEKPAHIAEDTEWSKLNRKALSVIRLTLTRNVAYNVAKETTAYGIMKALANTYDKPSTLNKLHLVRRLFELKMAEGGSVPEHFHSFQVITTQLETFKFNLDGDMKVPILLSSLPKSWSTIVEVIGSMNPLTFEEVRDRILNLMKTSEGKSALNLRIRP